MHNPIFELFLYILLWIWMSSFITGLGLIIVDLPLRLAINGPYISQHLLYLPLILDSLISWWWITCTWSSSQLVALHCWIFFWITWPSLFVCLWIPSYFIPLWWNIGIFCSICGIEEIYPLIISSEHDDPSIGMNNESIILMLVICDSIFLDQIGKWWYICHGLNDIPHVTIVWDHRLHWVDFGYQIIYRYSTWFILLIPTTNWGFLIKFDWGSTVKFDFILKVLFYQAALFFICFAIWTPNYITQHMREYIMCLNKILSSCCPWADCWHIVFFIFSWLWFFVSRLRYSLLWLST